MRPKSLIRCNIVVTDNVVRCGLHPLAVVLSFCVALESDSDDESGNEDDEQAWAELAAEAASMLTFLVKEGTCVSPLRSASR
jgi:hypothetical protein